MKFTLLKVMHELREKRYTKKPIPLKTLETIQKRLNNEKYGLIKLDQIIIEELKKDDLLWKINEVKKWKDHLHAN